MTLPLGHALHEKSEDVFERLCQNYESGHKYLLEHEEQIRAYIDGVDDLKDTEIFLQLKRTCDADPAKDWVPAYYFDICLLN